MKIQESAENYLESILILKNEKGVVHSIDIVQRMNFTKPSVSRAMSLLRGSGCITMDKEGKIELTQAGRVIAERIYERHRLISEWLMALGVCEAVAVQDACRIEHDISEESFSKIKAYVEGMQGRFL